MDAAASNLSPTFKAFALNNNIRLIEGEASKLSKRLGQAGKVSHYMNEVFLIRFKSSVQESLMVDAWNKKDLNGMEQRKNSLLKFAEEGLGKLDTMRTFQGDGSLTNACRKVLEFQRGNDGEK